MSLPSLLNEKYCVLNKIKRNEKKEHTSRLYIEPLKDIEYL